MKLVGFPLCDGREICIFYVRGGSSSSCFLSANVAVALFAHTLTDFVREQGPVIYLHNIKIAQIYGSIPKVGI